jgi:hypothetical protein
MSSVMPYLPMGAYGAGDFQTIDDDGAGDFGAVDDDGAGGFQTVKDWTEGSLFLFDELGGSAQGGGSRDDRLAGFDLNEAT